jgi:hypothetical protein
MLIRKSRLATYAKHAKVTQVINDITSCHDYKVVNSIQLSHINHIVIPTSTFEFREQASPISEGVAKIRINSHLAREKNNLTTRHT